MDSPLEMDIDMPERQNEFMEAMSHALENDCEYAPFILWKTDTMCGNCCKNASGRCKKHAVGYFDEEFVATKNFEHLRPELMPT